ncbi:DUF3349 domain-containing protein [Acidothermaceae bacterium B102]|nr:DUF3349 domain-containing protein [Acidothermaceae bacterium B102]
MLPNVLQSVVDFLRAGYPEGVPQHDYQPLFALLRMRLTPEQISLVAQELNATGDLDTAAAIKAAIETVTDVEPNDEDVARVRAHLAAGGWPLATIE